MSFICLTKALVTQPSLALLPHLLDPGRTVMCYPIFHALSCMSYFAFDFTEYLTEGRVYSASQFEDTVHSSSKAMGLGARGSWSHIQHQNTEEMDICGQLACCVYFSPGSQPKEWCCPQLEASSYLIVNQI